MSIITLTTDYGFQRPLCRCAKGKNFNRSISEAQIIDISHYIHFNTVEAVILSAQPIQVFQKEPFNLIGVDMESNKENKHCQQWNDHYFIAADNEFLTLLSEKIVQNSGNYHS
jgi:S-adenosylmethionine hydrolase